MCRESGGRNGTWLTNNLVRPLCLCKSSSVERVLGITVVILIRSSTSIVEHAIQPRSTHTMQPLILASLCLVSKAYGMLSDQCQWDDEYLCDDGNVCTNSTIPSDGKTIRIGVNEYISCLAMFY